MYLTSSNFIQIHAYSSLINFSHSIQVFVWLCMRPIKSSQISTTHFINTALQHSPVQKISRLHCLWGFHSHILPKSPQRIPRKINIFRSVACTQARRSIVIFYKQHAPPKRIQAREINCRYPSIFQRRRENHFPLARLQQPRKISFSDEQFAFKSTSSKSMWPLVVFSAALIRWHMLGLNAHY